ncbi:MULTISPECIES: PBP1A family penicillin-binding protein [unclassified Novosphingobium]|uniref:transglycosylase domain-containing protein n=1 Tax=unclassified Novosphingobium TaxID=2644732 RepID=UPI000EC83095|nr:MULTISPECIES: PBP1A family penicillin-binding protein [unclassified Novosphingobium]HCF25500.1 penicillin-binding protein [Novosphingobium sp.]HQV03197.1 PBP1A family penicillin-binding protein [Novosphingobium sp.]
MARNDFRRSPPPPRGGKPAKPAPTGFRKFVRRLFVWGTSLALLGLLALTVAVALTAQSLPSFDQIKTTQTEQMIVVRARDGTQLVSLGPSYGKWVGQDQIPQVMKDAMLSTEDKRYYGHIGIDPIGLARSFWVRFQEGRWKQGGSTITQQLARTVFLNNSRSFARKLREGVLALALEWKFSKDQILELYLNKVYFGGGAYGVDSASRKFFGHPATEISLPEAAIIAGLVKAPSNYAPTADAEAAVGRGTVVLGLMAENGKITPAQAKATDLKKIKFAQEAGQNSVRYFTDWALPQLDLLLGDNDQPIEVWTTLDVKLQNAATAAIQNNVPGGAQGALVSMDRDGAVLALVGGTDYVTSNYNRAVNAVRQPGSAWKLFVYLAALEAGYTPNAEVVDEPVTIEGWSPRNSGGGYAGKIDVRTAFAYSKNTVAAQLGQEVGFSAVAGMAKRFGISTPISTVPSMVLGTNEVRLIDMTRAFASISAKGQAVEPYGIVKVTTTDGGVLYQRKNPGGNLLVPAYVASGITDMLQSAVSIGTGKAAQIGRPVAGKTGTTTANKDGWFLGFSSGVTTGVWMGRDDDRPVPGLQGGTAPARAFASYMKVAVSGRPVEKFETDATLPAWQLEPDDQVMMSGSPEDYYYVDEQGNLVNPDRSRDTPLPKGPPDGGLVPVDPPPAAGEDFLNEATGRDRPPPSAPN